MKNRILIFILLFVSVSMFSQEYPCLFVNSSDSSLIQEKIEKEPWANEAFGNIVNRVEKYVDIHEKDKSWIWLCIGKKGKDTHNVI